VKRRSHGTQSVPNSITTPKRSLLEFVGGVWKKSWRGNKKVCDGSVSPGDESENAGVLPALYPG
jgi:hypothetical protein